MTARSTRPANLNRRRFLAASSCLAAGMMLASRSPRAAAPSDILTRPIPATGERIPAIGMGTWITFNVGDNKALRADRTRVLEAFFAGGGGLIDSSPMYGTSEEVVGHCLSRVPDASGLFSATKVWTYLQSRGVAQMAESRRLWRLERFDLMQIHNLLDWESHLETLVEDKAQGRIRYIGVTTSHGRRHDELEAIMSRQPIDFIQITYNIADREAEARLLPLAAERGLGVIINRPFRQGALCDFTAEKPLPAWASDIDCTGWPQVLLKFIVSHPAVTCAIPATSRVDHMQENMAALTGRLPDPDLRARMIRDFDNL